MDGVLAFVGVAALLSVTPGAATALVVRSALRGGPRAALLTIAGNAVGVLAWALLRARRGGVPAEPSARTRRAAFRDAVLTSLANPKLSVFFVALFPQFVPDGAPVLPLTVAMGLLVVAIDFAWYSLLAVLVSRAQRAFRAAFAHHLERLTGTVLVALGARLALEHRG